MYFKIYFTVYNAHKNLTSFYNDVYKLLRTVNHYFAPPYVLKNELNKKAINSIKIASTFDYMSGNIGFEGFPAWFYK